MTMRRTKLAVAGSLFALSAMALAGQAQAAAFINGSFELSSADPASGSFSTLGAGSTVITGWTVFSGSIDYTNGLWQSVDGTHTVDLAGTNAGAIQQTFTTIPGMTYFVSYYLSGNPDGGGQRKPFEVTALDATSNAVLYDSRFNAFQGPSRTDMQYDFDSISFLATSASSTIRFASTLAGSPYGPVIDNVSVTTVPEPAAWAMMIGGFGLIGGAMRRRRTSMSVRFA